MKKSKISKLLGGMLLATSLILASSITVQAVGYDYNSDGFVNSKDLAILKTNLLLKTIDVKYDVNGDGKVNIIDYRALSTISPYNLNIEVFAMPGTETMPKVFGQSGIRLGTGTGTMPTIYGNTGTVGTISTGIGTIIIPIDPPISAGTITAPPATIYAPIVKPMPWTTIIPTP